MVYFERRLLGHDPGLLLPYPLSTQQDFTGSLISITGYGQIPPDAGGGYIPALRDVSKTNRFYPMDGTVLPSRSVGGINNVRIINSSAVVGHGGYIIPCSLFSGREGLTFGWVGTVAVANQRVFSLSGATDDVFLELIKTSLGTVKFQGRRHNFGETLCVAEVDAPLGADFDALIMSVDYTTGELWLKNLITDEEDTSDPLDDDGCPTYEEERFRARLFARSSLSDVSGAVNAWTGQMTDFHMWEGTEMAEPGWFTDYLIAQHTDVTT